MPNTVLLCYLISISAIAVIITIYDKLAAKWWSRHRIPEKALLLIGALGGAALMFSTMVFIRHKTRKPKFMVTLPLFIVLHITLLCILKEAF